MGTTITMYGGMTGGSGAVGTSYVGCGYGMGRVGRGVGGAATIGYWVSSMLPCMLP